MSMSKHAVESTRLEVPWVPKVGDKVEVRAGQEQLHGSLLVHATEAKDNKLCEVSANGTCKDITTHDWVKFDTNKSLALVERDSKGNVKGFQRVEFERNFSSRTKKKKHIHQIVYRYPDDDHEANVKLRKKVYGKYLKGEVKEVGIQHGRPAIRVKITTTMTELAAKHRAIANDSFWFAESEIRPHLALKRLDQKGGKKGRTNLVGDHDTRLCYITMGELGCIADHLKLEECGVREMEIILRYPIEIILRSRRWDRDLKNVRASYDQYIKASPFEREQVGDYLKFECKMEMRARRMRVLIEKRDPRILWAFRVFIELLVLTSLVEAGQANPNTLPPVRDDWEALCDINTARCSRTITRQQNMHEANRQAMREQERARQQEKREREEHARSRAVQGTAKYVSHFALEERSRLARQTPQRPPRFDSPRMTTARMTVTDHRGQEPLRREDIVLRVPFPNRFPVHGPTTLMYYEYARVSPHYHQHQFAGQMCRILNPRPGVCYDVVICSGVRSSKCIKFSARDISCGTLLPLDRCREEMMLDNFAQVQTDLQKVNQGILHPCQFTFNQRGNWESLCALGDDLEWMTDGTRLVKFVGMTVSIRVPRPVRVTRYSDLDDSLKFELTRACRELVENGFNGELVQTTALGIKVLGGSVRRERDQHDVYTFKGTVRVNVQNQVAEEQWPRYETLGHKFHYRDTLTGRTYHTTLMVFDAERIVKFRDYNKMARGYEAQTASLPTSYEEELGAESFLTFLDAIKGFDAIQQQDRQDAIHQQSRLSLPGSDHRRSASNSPTPGRVSSSDRGMEEAAPVDGGRKGPLYNLGQQVCQQTPSGELLVGTITQAPAAQSHTIQLPGGEWGYTVEVHTGTNHKLYMCDQDIIDTRLLPPVDLRAGTMRKLMIPNLGLYSIPVVRESQITLYSPFPLVFAPAPVQPQQYLRDNGASQDLLPIAETAGWTDMIDTRHSTASDQGNSDSDEECAAATSFKHNITPNMSIASDNGEDSEESNQGCATDGSSSAERCEIEEARPRQSGFPTATRKKHGKYPPPGFSRQINTFVDG